MDHLIKEQWMDSPTNGPRPDNISYAMQARDHWSVLWSVSWT